MNNKVYYYINEMIYRDAESTFARGNIVVDSYELPAVKNTYN